MMQVISRTENDGLNVVENGVLASIIYLSLRAGPVFGAAEIIRLRGVRGLHRIHQAAHHVLERGA